MNKRVASIQNIDEDIYLKEMADRFNYPQMTIEIADQIETLQNRGATNEQIINALQTIGERGGSLFSAAMYQSPKKTIEAFYDDVNKAKNKHPRFYQEDFSGVVLDFPSNAVQHDKNKHTLSREEWIGIAKAIRQNNIIDSSFGEYNRMGGSPIKMILDVGGVEYALTFEHFQNGRNLVQSAFKFTDKGWFYRKSSQTAASEPQPKSRRLGNSLPEIINNVDAFVKKNGTLYSRGSTIKGLYNPTERVAKLFKSQTPDTLMHELSHNFFANYFELTEQYGLSERNKAIYDMLGKQSSKEFEDAEWETITEEFMKYIRTSEAPNIAARNLFERAKDWIIETFYTLNKNETPSPEVKEFFDNLIRDDMRSADLTDLQMSPRALKDVLKSIKTGNEVGLKGVRRSDLTALRKATHAFTPRKAKTLAEIIKRDDMQIKVYIPI